ncbi:hypothetical protein LTR65_010883 [Meristemomyces frigidus]
MQDVKPDNIMISKGPLTGRSERKATLIDYNLAYEDGVNSGRARRSGTATYMSAYKLQSAKPQPHHIYDDFESFLWVLVYCATADSKHKKGCSWENSLIYNLHMNGEKMSSRGASKYSVLSLGAKWKAEVQEHFKASFKNSEEFMAMIQEWKAQSNAIHVRRMETENWSPSSAENTEAANMMREQATALASFQGERAVWGDGTGVA